jgi:hypothetical protein
MEFHPSDGHGNQAPDMVLMLMPGKAAENAEARKRARKMDKVRREADSDDQERQRMHSCCMYKRKEN